MAKSKSYGGFVLLLIGVAAAGAAAWYYYTGGTEKQPEFTTTKVDRGDIVQAVTATGDLQPVVIVDVSSQISGLIKEVRVDFNSVVKAGDILALIDESTYVQRLRQAEADLASAKATNQLSQLNAGRQRELFEKKLISQQELDNAEAQLAQSNAALLTRTASVENAKVDLSRCTITAPIDGIVLDRKTDKGRTVAASLNAPTLFTLVNDLTKMQINAAVAEADIGTIAESQPVKFTVDAFPDRTFTGTVRQVRNAAAINQSVVSYATIIDVDNSDLKLKPGMTANVSIIVSERKGVLRGANGALRVRIPQDLLPPAPTTPADGKKGEKTGPAAVAAMTDDERRRATMEVIRESGFQFGSTPSAETIAKAKLLARERGLDPDLVAARLTTPPERLRERGGDRGGGGNGGGGGGGGFRYGRGRGGGDGPGPSRGAGSGTDRFNNTIVERTLYKLTEPAPDVKKIEPTRVRLGISDGLYTEVLAGATEGDLLVTNVTLPGAGPVTAAPAGMQNPFQGSRGFGGPGGYSGRRGG